MSPTGGRRSRTCRRLGRLLLPLLLLLLLLLGREVRVGIAEQRPAGAWRAPGQSPDTRTEPGREPGRAPPVRPGLARARSLDGRIPALAMRLLKNGEFFYTSLSGCSGPTSATTPLRWRDATTRLCAPPLTPSARCPGGRGGCLGNWGGRPRVCLAMMMMN